jgi:hypothetical protein
VPDSDIQTPLEVAAALARAMNAHDIEAFVSLFSEDYDSEQPAHPDRSFRGRDQVRANWSAVFSGVPDFRADLVATAVDSDTAWTEWRWYGTTRMAVAWRWSASSSWACETVHHVGSAVRRAGRGGRSGHRRGVREMSGRE